MRLPQYKVISAVRPSAAITAEYRRKLSPLFEEVARSIDWWIGAEYNKLSPRIAQDASPEQILIKRLRQLVSKWGQKLDAAAPDIADWLGGKVNGYTSNALRYKLNKAGFTVPFKVTPRLKKTLNNIITENRKLIKSIPAIYGASIEQSIKSAVYAGRDGAALRRDLEEKFGLTENRAINIARDQMAKATEYLVDARAESMGITRAVWFHIPGRYTSRPTHKEMSGKVYEIKQGIYDREVNRFVVPGELIYCACTKNLVIPEWWDNE